MFIILKHGTTEKLPYQLRIFLGQIFMFGGILFILGANLCGKILKSIFQCRANFIFGGQFFQLGEILNLCFKGKGECPHFHTKGGGLLTSFLEISV